MPFRNLMKGRSNMRFNITRIAIPLRLIHARVFAILRYRLPNVRSGILADDGRSHRITMGSLSGALVFTMLPIQ